MKRINRVGSILKILSDSPNTTFPLDYFCKLLNAAKSSISEDITLCKSVVLSMDLGKIETAAGAKGGVRFVPFVTDLQAMNIQNNLCSCLNSPDRILGGGFLYTSDIMFNPSLAKSMASVFARKFSSVGADYVATIETKGIPLAMMTAHLLNIPVVVVRRETKISEGPTVSINYFSGSSDRIQKMSMAKKATKPGTRALIIDDFMRAGGSLKGIVELLGEFDVHVCGIGVAIASTSPINKKVSSYSPLVYLGPVDEDNKTIEITPNTDFFKKNDTVFL